MSNHKTTPVFSKHFQQINTGKTGGLKSLLKPNKKMTGVSTFPLVISSKRTTNHPFKWHVQNIELKICQCRDLMVVFTAESTEDSCVTNCRIVCKSASLTAMKLIFWKVLVISEFLDNYNNFRGSSVDFRNFLFFVFSSGWYRNCCTIEVLWLRSCQRAQSRRFGNVWIWRKITCSIYIWSIVIRRY